MQANHRFLSLLLTITVALLTTAVADDKKEEKPKPRPTSQTREIGVLVEHIRVDQVTGTKIMRDYRGDGPALRKKLQSLVDEKKAELIESAYVIARDGTRAEIESVDEYIYPTEYDPPESPSKVTGKVAEGVNLTTPSNPTAFDSRKLGNTLVVKVDIDRATGLLTLGIIPEVVEYIGDTTYGKGLAEVKQPSFHVLRAVSNLTVKSDRYALLGLLTPRDPKTKAKLPKRDSEHRIFVVLRATILEDSEKP